MTVLSVFCRAFDLCAVSLRAAVRSLACVAWTPVFVPVCMPNCPCSSFVHCFFCGGPILAFLALRRCCPWTPQAVPFWSWLLLALQEVFLLSDCGCPWTPQAFFFGLSFLRVALSPHVFLFFFVPFKSFLFLALQEVPIVFVGIPGRLTRKLAHDCFWSCKKSDCVCWDSSWSHKKLPPTPIRQDASRVVPPPADEAGKVETQEERRPARRVESR